MNLIEVILEDWWVGVVWCVTPNFIYRIWFWVIFLFIQQNFHLYYRKQKEFIYYNYMYIHISHNSICNLYICVSLYKTNIHGTFKSPKLGM